MAGGGHVVEVPPERLSGWFDRFAERNDGIQATTATPAEVVVTGRNGTAATATVPFPPLDAGLSGGSHSQGTLPPTVRLVVHARRPRRIGLLLVRLGAHSVGIADNGKVIASRTARHLVHGRSAAGGWSQHRFARRRQGQVREALREAAGDVLDVLVPRLAELDAVVLGGDRRALGELRADRRLAVVFSLATPRILDLGEPRRVVLAEAAERARAVEILVRPATTRKSLDSDQ